MRSPRILSVLITLAAVALLAASAAPAMAQAQTIKIGTLYDHSGPFSAAGSLNCWRGWTATASPRPTWRSTRRSGC